MLAIWRSFEPTSLRYASGDRGGKGGLASFDEVRLALQCTKCMWQTHAATSYRLPPWASGWTTKCHHVFVGVADGRLALAGKDNPDVLLPAHDAILRIIRVATQLSSD